jgi:hypothetical protein
MSARTRLWLDLGMFAVLLAAYNPELTGLPVHEWLSVAVIVPLLIHLIINWEWTVRITTAFLDRLFHTSRLNLIVDTTLFVSTVAVMLSGLMVSRVALAAFGLAVVPSAAWIALHAVSADMTVVLLIAHFALHAKWFARVLGVRKLVPSPQAPTGLRR